MKHLWKDENNCIIYSVIGKVRSEIHFWVTSCQIFTCDHTYRKYNSIKYVTDFGGCIRDVRPLLFYHLLSEVNIWVMSCQRSSEVYLWLHISEIQLNKICNRLRGMYQRCQTTAFLTDCNLSIWIAKLDRWVAYVHISSFTAMQTKYYWWLPMVKIERYLLVELFQWTMVQPVSYFSPLSSPLIWPAHFAWWPSVRVWCSLEIPDYQKTV